MNFRPIAIYLPQFHPIPENDVWWGKGFTEWINVTKAKPLFKGHYQPHLPADLGFYDLRLPEVREQQVKLAKEYGIYGFCYYHYWFNGRRILERPFQEVFESGKPDFPFMLCWANENWTRAWDGTDKEVLLEQKYSEEDDVKHIRYLIPYFKDERYIKIKGKPVFAVYKSTLLPNAKKTIDIWRREARSEGIELYICRFENFGDTGEKHLIAGGFDAGIDFQPFGNGNWIEFKELRKRKKESIKKKSLRFFYGTLLKVFNKRSYRELLDKDNYTLDYSEYVNYITEKHFPEYNWFPGITPMWDNSARRNTPSFVLYASTPEKYAEWLGHILNNFKPKTREENFIFINAWNEWAEGNHLEPCQKWGLEYLKKTKEALQNLR